MRLLPRSIVLAAASLGCAHAPAPSTGTTSDVHLSGTASTPRSTNHPPFPADYRCVPYHDAHYAGGAQTIPGRLQNEYYDELDVSTDAQSRGAEEGACYHDTDLKNSGSGPGSLPR